MDFYRMAVREIEKGPNKGKMELYPDFVIGKSRDLMVRGKAFHAIWDQEVGLWSTDEYDVQRLVDAELDAWAAEQSRKHGMEYLIRHLRSAGTGGWFQFRRYMQNISDNSQDLDTQLTWANTEVRKEDYVSRRLAYPLEAGSFDAWDELVGTLYSVEERAKLEWIIGAIVTGDSKTIQKFGVLYGPPASGKSTILDIIHRLFEGYTTTFDARALGSSSAAFATEVFKKNPLVAIQHDGDLSKLEDNARLNSITAHEMMTMNEKYKPGYDSKVLAFLLMGTNQPVKISDAKSGIIRRLIDIHPTGVQIPVNRYFTLLSQVDFELGAIAAHCRDVYLSMGKNYYKGYRPMEMMLQTDIFFNFIEDSFGLFKKQDGTTLHQAYLLYKEYCAATGIQHVMPRYKLREELRNYFDEYKDRGEFQGQTVRSLYKGFTANKFKEPLADEHADALVMEETISLLDQELANMPAQYGNDQEMPKRKWEKVTTTLSDLTTTDLHYVKIPEQMVIIDFDIQFDGEKSLEANLKAASNWPPTYAELSKGGAGVHLTYYYDGDVRELSQAYSDGIEVKTLLGDASLRRRLSKCNNVPIATINSGLPLKEKSVITDKQVQSERGLRELIMRNVRKEIHPGTKPSIDFIKKILDDAYEQGMNYDLEDMRPLVTTFAMRSNHQPDLCLRLVTEMKWKSEVQDLRSEEPYDSDEDDILDVVNDPVRLTIYDVEVFPNVNIVCWSYEDSDQVVEMINPTPDDIAGLLKHNLVGFNVRRYDNHILYAILMGLTPQEVYKVSKRIIHKMPGAYFGEAYSASYADIYDFSAIKKSLKKWQIELGLVHQEFQWDWDTPLPEDMWASAAQYCGNDVVTTKQVLQHLQADLTARLILAELSGLTPNHTTQQHAARIIFGNERQPQNEFNIPDLKKEFPGYEFDMGKSTYKGENPSEGGYVYAEYGYYENVAVLDIASMHPATIEAINMFGPYTENFSGIKAARLAIKRGDYESASQMLGGRLAPFLENRDLGKDLSYALKIVINTVYGLTAARFDNPFKSHQNKDNVVAKRGALFMIDLKNACLEKGMNVVHIKTDSIKIANATETDIKYVQWFGDQYGYTFEHESTYEKFCLVNDAVYIAREDGQYMVGEEVLEEEFAKVGKWTATGAQFAHPVVFKTLFSQEVVELEDFFETKQVSTVMYMDLEYDRPAVLSPEGMSFIGRIGQFLPVVEGSEAAGVLYRLKDEKLYSVTGTKGYIWVERTLAESGQFSYDIDMSYYDKLLTAAKKQIEKYITYEEFIA